MKTGHEVTEANMQVAIERGTNPREGATDTAAMCSSRCLAWMSDLHERHVSWGRLSHPHYRRASIPLFQFFPRGWCRLQVERADDFDFLRHELLH